MRHIATCLAAFGLITAGAAFAGENCTYASGATCSSGADQVVNTAAEGATCAYSGQTAAAAECPPSACTDGEVAAATAADCDTAACPESKCTGNETVAATADEAVETAPGGADEAPAAE